MTSMKPRGFLIRIATLYAGFILALMGGLMLYRAATETTIFDETSHIAAGYSYAVLRDYRLNPEHPPLVKLAAALPLALQDISFPIDSPSWTEEINGQWVVGEQFLFGGNNDPVSITLWARLAPILFTLALGVILFRFALERTGVLGASIAITLFAFSPTFLAHGPLVTTDASAAMAALGATYFLVRWLSHQTWRNLLYAGIAFGIAQLIKFSMILLVPYFGIAILLWVLLKDRPRKFLSLEMAQRLGAYAGRLMLIGVVGMLTVYPIYAYTISAYPAEVQRAQTTAILESSSYPTVANAIIWASDTTVLRPYAQYALGHLMVLHRVQDGNTVYFLGDVAKEAWVEYFPVVFALKEPLALLVLLGGGIAFCLTAPRKTKQWNWKRWGSRYAVEIILLAFPLLYLAVSMVGNLNIGIRHILPTMPFLYLILSAIIVAWVRGFRNEENIATISELFTLWTKRWAKLSIIAVLLAWYSFSSLATYPHSLAYFNELAGGPSGGYRFVTDSNLDWGQDLRRLAAFTRENNISEIRVDYFGTASPRYFLGDAYIPFTNTPGERHGWIAISATKLQEGRATPTKGYADKATDYYRWLDAYEPVTVLGHSIFIYSIP